MNVAFLSDTVQHPMVTHLNWPDFLMRHFATDMNWKHLCLTSYDYVEVHLLVEPNQFLPLCVAREIVNSTHL